MTTWTAPKTWVDGEFVFATTLNHHVRDNLMVIGEHRYTPKSSDQNKASDTALANDSALVMAVGANETWHWRARIYIITGAGGFKYRWDAPSGSSGGFDVFDVNGTATAVFASDNVSYGDIDGSTASITDAGHYHGVLVTASTAGNLAFAWAQNASSGANSTVKAGSYIMARRVA